MIVSLISAVANNRVIGKNNKLPWKIPTDMKWFRQVTFGKPVIMGTKTFASMGMALSGRKNCVVTRSYDSEDCKNLNGLNDSLFFVPTLLDGISKFQNEEEVFLIGGSKIYEEGMKIADKMYITHVNAEPDGDTFFPEFDVDSWAISEKTVPVQGPKDQHPIEIVTYTRKR